jgi:malate synthase
VRLDDGAQVTPELVHRLEDEELARLRLALGEQAWAASRFDDARKLFERVALADDFADFLTVAAYELID